MGDQDTLIEQSDNQFEKSTVQLITKNHLLSTSVCAELGDGEQAIY